MKLFNRLKAYLLDTEKSFEERIFVLLTIIAISSVFIALAGDILTGENVLEIVFLTGVIIIVPMITYMSVTKGRVKLGVRLIVAGLVFVINPAIFFFGGGVEGGGVVWVMFSYLYIGLVLTGKWRTIMLILLTGMAVFENVIDYYFPNTVHNHSEFMFHVDQLISIVLVGVVCFVMVTFQNRLFKEENRHAKEEAARAEELNRSQNRFFSSMSHEIRTPINTILGLNEIILRQPDASEEIMRDAGNIEGAGKMLLSLINDILDFSKIEAGSMEIVPVDYRVGDMLSEIVNMIWLRANEKGLEFSVDVDPEVPSVLYGDEVRIKQILINLLNNAVKYTREGSVGLHIESDETGENKVMLKIAVSDTGIGIKQDAIPHLFDAFQRMDMEKNRYIEGTGLGLSIVKQLVELMGGKVTVNSVYTEGSTFTVSIEQTVSDSKAVGDINIANYGKGRAYKKYKAGFSAPGAAVLIVDDNKLNLEVESKLLDGTDVVVDTAVSGAEALRKTLLRHYDVILMDHFMPEMDGIEALKAMRAQTGGLNRDVPVVVLTANAGSENRELYNAAGFDGYLIKPVSGSRLQEMLLKHIPAEKLAYRADNRDIQDEISTAKGYIRKIPVLITAGSTIDIPEAVIKQLRLDIIPFSIKTESGTFRDYFEMGADEIIYYMQNGGEAESMPPEVADYTEFFGRMLRKAHQVIHIAISPCMSDEYERATEAARSFENVSVVNSEGLSSATGLLVMIAYRLAQQNQSADRIVEELNEVKKHIHCTFIINSTENMASRGFISERVHNITKMLELRPAIRVKDDKMSIMGFWMGSRKRAFERYILKALPPAADPNRDVLFVAYADLTEDEIGMIEHTIRRRFDFDHIVFKQTSAAVTANCGPGSFGLLYMDNCGKDYKLQALLPKEKDETAGIQYAAVETEAVPDALNVDVSGESRWCDGIEGIDADTGIHNSGSEDTYKTVLSIFRETIDDYASEIDGYYNSEDWENYTIKVHALKSSAKLAGALSLADEAMRLENAGKGGDIDYIKAHNEAFVSEYRGFKEKLDPVILKTSGAEEEDAKEGGTVADREVIKLVYEAVKQGAQDMDYDAIESAFAELEGYVIPKEEEEKFGLIKDKSERFDYEGILEILDEKTI